MSHLREVLDDYLTIRRSGFKLKNASCLLPKLVTYLEQAGADTVTTELALAWARQPAENPIQWSERLKAVRGFARHLQSLDPRTEVPPAYVLPARRYRTSPYLYSESDIAKLLQAARALAPPMRAATYETLIGLLAVTGLRVSEAISLDRQDLDWSAGVLTVRLTKFHKSRQVALHNPAWEATNNTAERGGRVFRHAQHPHFRLRTLNAIDADIKVRACLQKERASSPPPRRLHHCQRGRALRHLTFLATTCSCGMPSCAARLCGVSSPASCSAKTGRSNCEELMEEAGFYDTPGLWRLKNAMWRAVRLMVDVDLHCRRRDLEAAARPLVELGGLEPNTA